MATLAELRKLARDRKIPNRSKLKTKAQYLSALGMSDEAKAQKGQSTKRKAIDAHSTAIADGNITKRAQIKGRLTRAVKRELDAAKKEERELSQDEKRAIAAKALAKEVKAIKAGKPEAKGKRGKKSLKELFDKADAIGKKYDDGTVSLDAHRKAKEFVDSTMGEVRAKAKGRKHLGVVDGGNETPKASRKERKEFSRQMAESVPQLMETMRRADKSLAELKEQVEPKTKKANSPKTEKPKN